MTKIRFNEVLKTTVTRTGTRIEYAMPKKDNSLITSEKYYKPKVFFDKAKIITFAKNSPLRKIKIDQAFLGQDKETGAGVLSFWYKGIFRMEAVKTKEEMNSVKFFLKVLRGEFTKNK